MTETLKTKPKQKSNLRLRTGLMFLLILLPFGLYAAMQMGSMLAAMVFAAGFVLSMAVMVWAG